MCIATAFVPKVESGKRADVPEVKLGEQRVNHIKDGAPCPRLPSGRWGLRITIIFNRLMLFHINIQFFAHICHELNS